MKFFLPEWDDRVDMDYDFSEDNHSSSEPANRQNQYIWHVFGWERVPIDGVLVSRAQVEQSPQKLKNLLKIGLHRYLGLPSDFEIISDCGAFDYIKEESPRYDPIEMMDFYRELKVTIGVTIDHIITKKDHPNRDYRYEITIENAKKMFDLWVAKDRYYNNYNLMGAIQGWDGDSYAKAANELIEHGFRYIGIGGLARSPTFFIEDVIKEVASVVKRFERERDEKVDIHIFGFARAELFDLISKAGITSFDSASMLRKAWLSQNDNYFHTYKKRYSAIRVRFSDGNSELKNLELEVLQRIRAYGRKEVDLDCVLEGIIEYERKTGDPKEFMERYIETLRDRPWEKCDCPICTKLGIEVCVFRGNNRNRRRGFHNIYIFYNYFRKKIPKVLVFTMCSATKDPYNGLLPAYRRYLGSTNFKAWWREVHDLPIVDLGIFSAKFGLIPWWKPIPNYDYKMKESDVSRFVTMLSKQLVKYDKVYFHGLGLYREVIEKVRDGTDAKIEIYPKNENTSRNKLDIIEYLKQIKRMRNDILNYLGIEENSALVFNKEKQSKLEEFVEHELGSMRSN